ncbi:uncharacterized protein [Engystomops pustulosus]|uniref:uncharacterized protein n=1 Tax=Engystomops pustulosus TaxID=76066 RepID=UPI003AFA3F86
MSVGAILALTAVPAMIWSMVSAAPVLQDSVVDYVTLSEAVGSSEEIDECLSNPCKNGGTCNDLVNGFSCSCPPGHSGIMCENDSTGCVSNPCWNGATCSDSGSGFSCSCVQGYTGRFCEIDLNNCSSTTCQNGGVCVDRMNDFFCKCPVNWKGKTCSTDVDECETGLSRCHPRAICVNTNGSYSCVCTLGYKGDGFICKEQRLFEYKNDIRITQLTKDFTSPLINVPIGFPFDSKFYYNLYFSDNGIIAFQRNSYDPLYTMRYPYSYFNSSASHTTPMIAAFWADADLSMGVGDIYYQVYNFIEFPLINATFRNEIENEVKNYFDIPPSFRALWVIKITWENVPPYPAVYFTKADTNTFQAILLTDGIYSFCLLRFEDGGMNWKYYALPTNHLPIMGYFSGNSATSSMKPGFPAFNDPQTEPSVSLQQRYTPDQYEGYNTHKKGLWAYRLETNSQNITNARRQCLIWYYNEPYPSWASVTPPCPCSWGQASYDCSFTSSTRLQGYGFQLKIADFSFSVQSAYASSKGGGTRCYYNSNGSLKYGEKERYLPLPWTSENVSSVRKQYQVNELDPYNNCCRDSGSVSLCSKFKEKRPVDNCQGYVPPHTGFLYGDPHINTLDGIRYTFNGLGEFILANIKDENGLDLFKLQGRTAIIRNSTATNFVSLAAELTNIIKVEWIVSEMTNIVVKVNGSAITLTEDSTYVNKVTLEKTSLNEVKATFDGGISITVSARLGYLSFVTTLLSSFQNKTQGLLGVFNGDISDDLMSINGSKLSFNGEHPAESLIYETAMTWKTTAENSIFTYNSSAGESWDTYNNNSFVPRFYDELLLTSDPSMVQRANETCKGIDECIFDILSTRDFSVGEATLESITSLKYQMDLMGNYPPNISGPTVISTKVNQSVTVSYTATDQNNDTVIFSLQTDSQDINITDWGVLIWNPRSSTPVMAIIQANDSKTVFEMPLTLVLCNCTNNGQCLYENPTNAENSTNFMIASCACNDSWTGSYCDQNIDACIENPCFTDTCSDNLAPEDGYTCGSCPEGLVGDGENCYDYNECYFNTSSCKQICINVLGGYNCSCIPGYIVNPMNTSSCDDIDECAHITSPCAENAICINGPGNFTCMCKPGYGGDPYLLCTDENECAASEPAKCPAQSICINTAGSYKCECLQGYSGVNCTETKSELLSTTSSSFGQATSEIMNNGFSTTVSELGTATSSPFHITALRTSSKKVPEYSITHAYNYISTALKEDPTSDTGPSSTYTTTDNQTQITFQTEHTAATTGHSINSNMPEITYSSTSNTETSNPNTLNEQKSSSLVTENVHDVTRVVITSLSSEILSSIILTTSNLETSHLGSSANTVTYAFPNSPSSVTPSETIENGKGTSTLDVRRSDREPMTSSRISESEEPIRSSVSVAPSGQNSISFNVSPVNTVFLTSKKVDLSTVSDTSLKSSTDSVTSSNYETSSDFKALTSENRTITNTKTLNHTISETLKTKITSLYQTTLHSFDTSETQDKSSFVMQTTSTLSESQKKITSQEQDQLTTFKGISNNSEVNTYRNSVKSITAEVTTASPEVVSEVSLASLHGSTDISSISFNEIFSHTTSSRTGQSTYKDQNTVFTPASPTSLHDISLTRVKPEESSTSVDKTLSASKVLITTGLSEHSEFTVATSSTKNITGQSRFEPSAISTSGSSENDIVSLPTLDILVHTQKSSSTSGSEVIENSSKPSTKNLISEPTNTDIIPTTETPYSWSSRNINSTFKGTYASRSSFPVTEHYEEHSTYKNKNTISEMDTSIFLLTSPIHTETNTEPDTTNSKEVMTSVPVTSATISTSFVSSKTKIFSSAESSTVTSATTETDTKQNVTTDNFVNNNSLGNSAKIPSTMSDSLATLSRSKTLSSTLEDVNHVPTTESDLQKVESQSTSPLYSTTSTSEIITDIPSSSFSGTNQFMPSLITKINTSSITRTVSSLPFLSQMMTTSKNLGVESTTSPKISYLITDSKRGTTESRGVQGTHLVPTETVTGSRSTVYETETYLSSFTDNSPVSSRTSAYSDDKELEPWTNSYIKFSNHTTLNTLLTTNLTTNTPQNQLNSTTQNAASSPRTYSDSRSTGVTNPEQETRNVSSSGEVLKSYSTNKEANGITKSLATNISMADIFFEGTQSKNPLISYSEDTKIDRPYVTYSDVTTNKTLKITRSLEETRNTQDFTHLISKINTGETTNSIDYVTYSNEKSAVPVITYSKETGSDILNSTNSMKTLNTNVTQTTITLLHTAASGRHSNTQISNTLPEEILSSSPNVAYLGLVSTSPNTNDPEQKTTIKTEVSYSEVTHTDSISKVEATNKAVTKSDEAETTRQGTTYLTKDPGITAKEMTSIHSIFSGIVSNKGATFTSSENISKVQDFTYTTIKASKWTDNSLSSDRSQKSYLGKTNDIPSVTNPEETMRKSSDKYSEGIVTERINVTHLDEVLSTPTNIPYAEETATKQTDVAKERSSSSAVVTLLEERRSKEPDLTLTSRYVTQSEKTSNEIPHITILSTDRNPGGTYTSSRLSTSLDITYKEERSESQTEDTTSRRTDTTKREEKSNTKTYLTVPQETSIQIGGTQSEETKSRTTDVTEKSIETSSSGTVGMPSSAAKPGVTNSENTTSKVIDLTNSGGSRSTSPDLLFSEETTTKHANTVNALETSKILDYTQIQETSKIDYVTGSEKTSRTKQDGTLTVPDDKLLTTINKTDRAYIDETRGTKDITYSAGTIRPGDGTISESADVHNLSSRPYITLLQRTSSMLEATQSEITRSHQQATQLQKTSKSKDVTQLEITSSKTLLDLSYSKSQHPTFSASTTSHTLDLTFSEETSTRFDITQLENKSRIKSVSGLDDKTSAGSLVTQLLVTSQQIGGTESDVIQGKPTDVTNSEPSRNNRNVTYIGKTVDRRSEGIYSEGLTSEMPVVKYSEDAVGKTPHSIHPEVTPSNPIVTNMRITVTTKPDGIYSGGITSDVRILTYSEDRISTTPDATYSEVTANNNTNVTNTQITVSKRPDHIHSGGITSDVPIKTYSEDRINRTPDATYSEVTASNKTNVTNTQITAIKRPDDIYSRGITSNVPIITYSQDRISTTPDATYSEVTANNNTNVTNTQITVSKRPNNIYSGGITSDVPIITYSEDRISTTLDATYSEVTANNNTNVTNTQITVSTKPGDIYSGGITSNVPIITYSQDRISTTPDATYSEVTANNNTNVTNTQITVSKTPNNIYSGGITSDVRILTYSEDRISTAPDATYSEVTASNNTNVTNTQITVSTKPGDIYSGGITSDVAIKTYSEDRISTTLDATYSEVTASNNNNLTNTQITVSTKPGDIYSGGITSDVPIKTYSEDRINRTPDATYSEVTASNKTNVTNTQITASKRPDDIYSRGITSNVPIITYSEDRISTTPDATYSEVTASNNSNVTNTQIIVSKRPVLTYSENTFSKTSGITYSEVTASNLPKVTEKEITVSTRPDGIYSGGITSDLSVFTNSGDTLRRTSDITFTDVTASNHPNVTDKVTVSTGSHTIYSEDKTSDKLVLTFSEDMLSKSPTVTNSDVDASKNANITNIKSEFPSVTYSAVTVSNTPQVSYSAVTTSKTPNVTNTEKTMSMSTEGNFLGGITSEVPVVTYSEEKMSKTPEDIYTEETASKDPNVTNIEITDSKVVSNTSNVTQKTASTQSEESTRDQVTTSEKLIRTFTGFKPVASVDITYSGETHNTQNVTYSKETMNNSEGTSKWLYITPTDKSASVYTDVPDTTDISETAVSGSYIIQVETTTGKSQLETFSKRQDAANSASMLNKSPDVTHLVANNTWPPITHGQVAITQVTEARRSTAIKGIDTKSEKTTSSGQDVAYSEGTTADTVSHGTLSRSISTNLNVTKSVVLSDGTRTTDVTYPEEIANNQNVTTNGSANVSLPKTSTISSLIFTYSMEATSMGQDDTSSKTSRQPIVTHSRTTNDTDLAFTNGTTKLSTYMNTHEFTTLVPHITSEKTLTNTADDAVVSKEISSKSPMNFEGSTLTTNYNNTTTYLPLYTLHVLSKVTSSATTPSLPIYQYTTSETSNVPYRTLTTTQRSSSHKQSVTGTETEGHISVPTTAADTVSVHTTAHTSNKSSSYGTASRSTILSSVAETTTTTQAVSLFAYGESAGDIPYVLRRTDFTSPLFQPVMGFPFGNKLRNFLYYTDNGQIIFPLSRSSVFSYTNPPANGFKADYNVATIAVFWDDADFSKNVGTTYYKEYMKSTSAKDSFITEVEEMIRRYMNTSYTAQWTLKITWDNAPSYPAKDNDNQTNTYQAVLTTDGFVSYILMLYKDAKMNWNLSNRLSRVVIGYSSGASNNFFKNDDIMGRPIYEKYRPSRYIGYNSDMKGLWIYTLNSNPVNNSQMKCLSWYIAQPSSSQWNSGLLSCPCLYQQGLADFRYRATKAAQSPTIRMLRTTFPSNYKAGVRCLYNLKRQFQEGFQERTWTFVPATPDIEIQAKEWCCNEVDNPKFCQMYSEKRPMVNCWDYKSLFPGWMYGDPHITTLDGLNYTFNGLGDFILLNASDSDSSLVLQGRTVQTGTAMATNFQAFAVQYISNSTNVKVEWYISNNIINTYINGQVAGFSYSEDMDALINNSYSSVFLINDGSITATFEGLISISVSAYSGILNAITSLPNQFFNKTQGLLGVWNQNMNDEFMRPDGSYISIKSTADDIYHFGKTWEVTQDTLFTLNQSTPKPNNFTPIFYNDLISSNMAKYLELSSICANKTECIYDALSTGNQTIGLLTQKVVTEFQSLNTSLRLMPPKIIGDSNIQTFKMERVQRLYDATGAGVQFTVYTSSDLNVTETGLLTWIPSSTDGFTFQLEAIDTYNLSSIFSIKFTVCNCRVSSECDYTQIIRVNTSSLYVAGCNCTDNYTDIYCHEPINPCTQGCYMNVSCDPVNGCGPCPAGLSGDGLHCSDIDECSHNVCSPNAVCTNTWQSYNCTCMPGFIGNGTHCEDLNECLTSPCSPYATCTNTIGSYICSCKKGFTGDGTYCNDENECLNNPCASNAYCSNTLGSFVCSCNVGYTGNGFDCTISCGQCIPNYCGNGQLCSREGSTCAQKCSCHPMFSDDRCIEAGNSYIPEAAENTPQRTIHLRMSSSINITAEEANRTVTEFMRLMQVNQFVNTSNFIIYPYINAMFHIKLTSMFTYTGNITIIKFLNEKLITTIRSMISSNSTMALRAAVIGNITFQRVRDGQYYTVDQLAPYFTCSLYGYSEYTLNKETFTCDSNCKNTCQNNATCVHMKDELICRCNQFSIYSTSGTHCENLSMNLNAFFGILFGALAFLALLLLGIGLCVCYCNKRRGQEKDAERCIKDNIFQKKNILSISKIRRPTIPAVVVPPEEPSLVKWSPNLNQHSGLHMSRPNGTNIYEPYTANCEVIRNFN